MKDVKSTSYQLRADELCKSPDPRAADAELRPSSGGPNSPGALSPRTRGADASAC